MATSQPPGNPASNSPSWRLQDPVTFRNSWHSQEWPRSGLRSHGLTGCMFLFIPQACTLSLGSPLYAGGFFLPLSRACPLASFRERTLLGPQGPFASCPSCSSSLWASCRVNPLCCFDFSAQQRSTQLNKKRAVPNQVAYPTVACSSSLEGGRALNDNQAQRWRLAQSLSRQNPPPHHTPLPASQVHLGFGNLGNGSLSAALAGSGGKLLTCIRPYLPSKAMART